MARRAALASELERQSGRPVADAEASGAAQRQAIPPSRRGKISFTIHVEPTVKAQMKLIAAETGRTVQDLMGEAINSIFRAHGKPEIAERDDGGDAGPET